MKPGEASQRFWKCRASRETSNAIIFASPKHSKILRQASQASLQKKKKKRSAQNIFETRFFIFFFFFYCLVCELEQDRKLPVK